MLLDNVLAIDLDSRHIKVLLGKSMIKRTSIKKAYLIDTPEDSVSGGTVKNIAAVAEAIKNFLEKEKVKANQVCFAIHGQDILVRHIEIPIMDEKNLRKSVELEVNQFLPDGGVNHYMDYKILENEITKEKKIYKILVAAAPRDKIDIYVQLAEALGLKLSAVDISSNCVARVFESSGRISGIDQNIGIINIGSDSSEIVILNAGKLSIDREVPFGLDNLIREIAKKLEVEYDVAYDYLIKKFNFKNIDQKDELNARIQFLFDNVLSSFLKVIQFYNTGKAEKKLDNIFIIGSGCDIPGIESYARSYFGSPVRVVNSPKIIGQEGNFPNEEEFKYHINTVGLLLRKE